MRLCLEADAALGVRHHPRRRGLPAGEQGTPAREPRSTFHEIYRPVSLLDGGVELAPLAGQLVHPAPQGSYLDGGQDTDLRPPVARQPVRCRAHESLEDPIAWRRASRRARASVSVVSPSASIADRFVLLMRRTYPSSSEMSLSTSPSSSWGSSGGLSPSWTRALFWRLPRICSIRLCRSALFARASASFMIPHLLTSSLSPRGSPVGYLCLITTILHTLDCMST